MIEIICEHWDLHYFLFECSESGLSFHLLYCFIPLNDYESEYINHFSNFKHKENSQLESQSKQKSKLSLDWN